MFSPGDVRFDPGEAAAELDRITAALRDVTLRDLRRRGAVVGLSGGIDSSVVAALCARAFGRERVLGLFMNDAESSAETIELGRLAAARFGIRTIDEPLAPMLAAAGCYTRRDDAIRRVIPEYTEGWRCKIVLPSVIESDRLRIFTLVVRAPDGTMREVRMPPEVYMQVVAATNFKQRLRKMLEYYHADREGYAVVGTPNLLEYDQGFFVKNGDGSADIKPIAHLYKTQVYQLAEYLELPLQIRSRPPTTDTYSMEQGQDEFYFSLPSSEMDLCLYGRTNGVPAAEVGRATGLTEAQVEHVYRDIDSKRRASRYLHAPPLLVEDISSSID